MLYLSALLHSVLPPNSSLTTLAFLASANMPKLFSLQSLWTCWTVCRGHCPDHLRTAFLPWLRPPLKHLDPREALVAHPNSVSPRPVNDHITHLKIFVVLWNYYVYFCLLSSYLFVFPPHQNINTNSEGSLTCSLLFFPPSPSDSVLNDIDSQIFTNWLNTTLLRARSATVQTHMLPGCSLPEAVCSAVYDFDC